jgi:hypothetical protein
VSVPYHEPSYYGDHDNGRGEDNDGVGNHNERIHRTKDSFILKGLGTLFKTWPYKAGLVGKV